MEIINGILLSLIAYFGVLVGLFIANMTKQEVRQGHNLILFLKEAIILMIIMLFLYHTSNDLLLISIGLAVGLLLGYVFRYIYFYLGIPMSLSFFISQDLLVSSLIFLFGLPHGSLMSYLSKKEVHVYLIKSLIFFSIPFISLLIPIDIGIFDILTGVMIGGLIYELKWPFS